MVHHCGKDDPCPKVNKDKLILYLQRFCPFCMRVNILLNYHGIDHELVYVNLTSKPDWFIQMNPQGKVPFIEKDGQKMGDSDMICAFLDQLDPSRSVAANSSEEAMGKVKSFMANKFKAWHSVLFDKDVSPEMRQTFLSGMADVEALLVGPFVSGAKMGLADILLFPIVSYTDAACQLINEPPPTAAQTPKIWAFLQAMRAVPAVAKVALDTALIVRFAKTGKEAGKLDSSID